jgi:hypothetical protein
MVFSDELRFCSWFRDGLGKGEIQNFPWNVEYFANSQILIVSGKYEFGRDQGEPLRGSVSQTSAIILEIFPVRKPVQIRVSNFR